MTRKSHLIWVVALLMAFTTAQFVWPCAADKSQEAANTSDAWTRENHPKAVELVFRESCTIPRGSKPNLRWVVCVLTVPSDESDLECGLSMERYSDGEVLASVVEPRAESVYRQLRKLHKERPALSVVELAKFVALTKRVDSGKHSPALQRLADELEKTRFSPVLPDQLMMDATKYEFRSRSIYGNTTSVVLYGPGPSLPKQPHPLLQWIESFKQLLTQTSTSTKES